MIEFKICLISTKKNTIRFSVEGLLFSSGIKDDTEKIFLVTNVSEDAKYGLINGQTYQLIGVIILGEIKDRMKKSFL